MPTRNLRYYPIWDLRLRQSHQEDRRRDAGGAPGRGRQTAYHSLRRLLNFDHPQHSSPEQRGGPAKDISFEFSASIKSSYGFVVSVLPFFKEELPSLCRKIVKALRQETGKGEAARLFRVGLSSVKRYARMACKGTVPSSRKRNPGKRGKPTAGQLLCRR